MRLCDWEIMRLCDYEIDVKWRNHKIAAYAARRPYRRQHIALFISHKGSIVDIEYPWQSHLRTYGSSEGFDFPAII